MVANGISKLDLKRQNRMQIIRLLRSNGPTSRIDIAREIAITKAAVTIITNEMIEQGVLYEKGEQPPRSGKLSRGRKKILLDISPTYRMDMGLVLDSGVLYFGICTLHGEPVEKHIVPIPAEETAEMILHRIETLYRDILYKNDLSPEQITGIGICLSPEYQKLFGITSENGKTNWKPFRKSMETFTPLPMTFGTAAEGAAIAECEYWQSESRPCSDLLVFRCGGQMTCTALIENELHRGAHGKSASMPAGTSEALFVEKCRRVFSEQNTPELWIAAGGNPSRILPEICAMEQPPLDPPVQNILGDFQRCRLTAIEDAVRFFDPFRVIFLDEPEGGNSLYAQLTSEAEAILSERGYPVSHSPICSSDFFLAGAALATRKFFLKRGGF